MADFRTDLEALIDSYRNKCPRDLVVHDLFYATDLVNKDPTWLYAAPIPEISSLTPATAVAGDAADIVMTVAGVNFSAGSVIYFNGLPEPTTLVSDTEVSTGVKPSLFVEPVICPVEVRNSDGGKSASLDFTFTAATRTARK
jgi:hypothetical protein